MRWMLTLLVFSLVSSPLAAQEICPTCIKEEQPQIVISRTESVEVSPDTAEIRLQIWIEEVRVEKATEKLRERMQTIFDIAAAEKIAKEDIKTLHYQVQPVYDGKRLFSAVERPKSYTVSQGVQLTVKNLDRVGHILARLSDIQDMNIEETVFTSSKIEEHKREALKKAAAAARKSAEDLAEVAGAKLGRVLKIQEASNFIPFRGQQLMRTAKMESSMMDRAAPMPVSGGKLTVEASCTLTYELE